MPNRFSERAGRYREAARRIPAPLGCALVLVLLPIVLVLALGVLVASAFGLRRRRRTEPAVAMPRTKEEAEHEVALCSLVRSLAFDGTFSREDALAVAVIGSSATTPSVKTLLDEAIDRGWIRGADPLSVTPQGRRAAEALLDRAGM